MLDFGKEDLSDCS